MNFEGKKVVEVVRLLEDGGIPIWLDGGWGIDALLGKETRKHRDLDFMLPLERLPTAQSVLSNIGFKKDADQTVMPTRCVLRNTDDLEIDIHPVTFKPDGSAIHIDSDEAKNSYVYVCSAAGLSGVGVIDGRIVRCTTAAEQIRQKIERRYSPWSPHRSRANGVSADLEDIISLLQVFGIEEQDAISQTVTASNTPADNPVVDAANQFCLRRVPSLSAKHSQLHAQFSDLTERHEKLFTELNSMQASASWRLTAPMRRAQKWIRKTTSGGRS